MQDTNENIVVIQGKEYDLSKLSDQDILKVHEYIIKKGNNLMEKIDKLISSNN